MRLALASVGLLLVSWGAVAESQGEELLTASEGWGEDQAAGMSAAPERAVPGVCWATPGQPEAAAETSAAPGAHQATAGGGACMVGVRLSPSGSASAVAAATPAEAEPAVVAEAVAPAPAPAPPPAAPVAAKAVVASEDRADAVPPPARKPKPVARKVSPPPAEALQAWWPSATPGRLNVRFAGEASFGSAIVLLFDAPFEQAASANQHVKVLDARKQAVSGQWVLAKGNPQMLLFKIPPGAYKLKIGEGLTAQGDLKLGAPSSGLVYVR